MTVYMPVNRVTIFVARKAIVLRGVGRTMRGNQESPKELALNFTLAIENDCTVFRN